MKTTTNQTTMTRVLLALPPEVLKDLTEAAKVEDRPRARLIREFLVTGLASRSRSSQPTT